jgi:hypothetical protein
MEIEESRMDERQTQLSCEKAIPAFIPSHLRYLLHYCTMMWHGCAEVLPYRYERWSSKTLIQ